MENIPKTVNVSDRALRNSKMTFADIYAVTFSRPEKIILERDEGIKSASYTYAEADILIKKAAGAVKKLGLKGRFIGLNGRADLEWIVMFWAILVSGNKPFLINSNLPTASVSSQLKTLDCTLVLSDEKTDGFGVMTISYGELVSNETDSVAHNFIGDDFGNELALSTSGTSLSEKICVYDGEEISRQILNAKYIIKNCKTVKKHYHGRLKLLLFLPLYHIFGLVATFFWFSFFGRTFVSLADYSSATILRTVKKYGVTHIFAVPILWHTIEKTVMREVRSKGETIAKKFEKGLDISIKLRNFCPALGTAFAKRAFKEVRDKLFGDTVFICISGGSYIKESTLKLINGLGYELHNGYGMSETGITSFEMSRKFTPRLAKSVGKPFPTVEYKLSDDGVLLVKGKTTCRYVYIDGVKTPADEWFYTGDVFTFENGVYAITGRKSDLVIGENGENLSPDLIEKQFDTDKYAFSVLGNEDMTGLIMVVRIPEDLFSLRLNGLNSDLESQNAALPVSFRLSKIFYTTDEIMPVGAIKVSRAWLTRAIKTGDVKLKTFGELNKKETKTSGDESEIYAILRGLVAKVLGVEESAVSADANFFTDLGGTSLEFFDLISKINEVFEIRLDSDYTKLEYTLSGMERLVGEYLK